MAALSFSKKPSNIVHFVLVWNGHAMKQNTRRVNNITVQLSAFTASQLAFLPIPFHQKFSSPLRSSISAKSTGYYILARPVPQATFMHNLKNMHSKGFPHLSDSIAFLCLFFSCHHFFFVAFCLSNT